MASKDTTKTTTVSTGFVRINRVDKLPDGVIVLVVACHDFDTYRSLPTVLEHNGRRLFGRTSWNSDRGEAYFRSYCSVAKVVTP